MLRWECVFCNLCLCVVKSRWHFADYLVANYPTGDVFLSGGDLIQLEEYRLFILVPCQFVWSSDSQVKLTEPLNSLQISLSGFLFCFKDENLTRIKRQWSFVLVVFDILTSLWFEAGHCPAWSSCWKGPFILITQTYSFKIQVSFSIFSICYFDQLWIFFFSTVGLSIPFFSPFAFICHSTVSFPLLVWL